MLLQFKLENFMSFKDEAKISMIATNIHEHEDSLIEIGGNKVLPVATIFGANASGKSNVFRAFLAMMGEVVLRFDKNETHKLIRPYAFCNHANEKATEFEVCIQIEGKEYRYGFARDEKYVYEEWLYEKKFSKRAMKEKCVFYRECAGTKKNTLHSEANKQEKKEIEFISSMTNNDELILQNLGKRAISKYACVYQWFCTTAKVADFSDDYDEFVNREHAAKYIYKEKALQKAVLNILHKIDEAIQDIKVEKEKDYELNDIYEVYFLHECEKSDAIWLSLNQESSGTKKMFSLAVRMLESLIAGKVLFMDELDAKLHPLVLRYILRMYSDKELNVGQGQLIFSSHNLICLDSSDLRRDEIWFVEKKNQESSLYSLYDFKEEEGSIRSDLSFGKHYLSGRFGAIPFQD